ncbi:suppressor of tub2 mutation [Rhodotorula sphaerocarpa]
MDWRTLQPGLTHAGKPTISLLDLAQLLQHARDHGEAVPDVELLAACLKPSLKSHHARVSNAALTALQPLWDNRRTWTTAHPHTLTHALNLCLPWDRLADAKVLPRQLAAEAVVAAARAALRASPADPADSPWSVLETGLRENAFTSKNARAREQGLAVLTALRCPPPTAAADEAPAPLPPLKPFTPLLLPLLADADPGVRALALETTVAVFAHPSVSDAARADLKKEMLRLDISKRVQDQILSQVLGDGSSTAAAAAAGPETGTNGHRNGTDGTAPASNAAGDAPVPTPAPSVAAVELAPVYLASERDLDAEFAAMHAGFEGRESEHNWTARDRSVARIRGMLLGAVATGPLQEALVRNVKGVQEGIIKTASSLRTTVALSALALIAELASSLSPSPAVDHLLDGFLAHCLSMAGQTKKIVASGSQATVTTLLEHAPYHLRTVQLVVALLGEKTASARQFGAQHVVTLLSVHAPTARAALDASGGTDALEAAVRKGLADANPQVRETARRAFWELEPVWPDRAAKLATTLDAGGRKLLDKARPAPGGMPTRPVENVAARSPVASTSRASGRPASSGAPRAATGSATPTKSPAAPAGGAKKPSVREAMMAARKKMLAEKESGAAPERQEGFIALGDEEGSPAPRSRSGSGSGPETPTRPRPSAAFTPESLASPELRSPASPAAALRTPASHVPDPIVDDALKEQARQAELAAERLLELSLDEAESGSDAELASGRAPFSASASASVATPRSARSAGAARSGPDAAKAPFSTPAPNPALRHFARAGHGAATAVFEDSPDPRDATGAAAGRGGWWERRTAAPHGETANLPPSAPLTEAEREEVAHAIAALQASEEGGAADVQALRGLSQLSRERPLREGDGDGGEGDVWQDERRFSKVYGGVRTLLLRPDTAEATRDAALRLLKDLVENQFPCFVGEEGGVFELVLQLRENPSRSSIAATELIANSFASRLEPVYGLGALKPALSTYLAASSPPCAGSFALGLRLLGGFYEQLPGEVLEDVLPQSAAIVQQALNDADSGDLRRAAIMALVSAQTALATSAAAAGEERDADAAHKLDELVGGLRPDQRNLVAYYWARRRQ